MSGGNLQRLRQCLVELHLPTFREHHGLQAALATKGELVLSAVSVGIVRVGGE